MLLKNGRLNRRGFLATTTASAVAATLPASSALAAPKRGGHMRVAKGHGATTDSLNPATTENGFTIPLTFGMHGRLTEVAQDGSLVPEIAQSWESSADATEWRFKIRRGVTFHSGRTLTVDDVIASLNHHRGANTTSAAAPIVAPIKELSADGSDTVYIKLNSGNADFPFILTDYHLSIHPANSDGTIDWQSGDGCGAYALKNLNMGVSVELVRNENHWRSDVGWFDSIEMLSVVDQNARTTALISGDAHAIDKVDLKAAGLLARRPGLVMESVAGTQHYTFAMSTNRDPFTDNNVRQALKYAINRQELVDKILFGYGSVGNDHPIGSGQRYFNSELEQKTYDPDMAKWYLRQSGLDSVKVSLSASDAAFGNAVDAAILYQASAAEAGIEVEVVREPKDGYWADVWMQKPFSAVYWGGRPVEDQMFTTTYQCGASWNDTFWCNRRFEALLVQARAELDENKRREMYWEMQDLVANDGGAVIPMFANYVFATTDDIAHGEMATNWDMDGERWMERWWFA